MALLALLASIAASAIFLHLLFGNTAREHDDAVYRKVGYKWIKVDGGVL